MTTTDIESLKTRAIVFYDGSCGFCQASVQFVLKHNKKENLYFTPLDSGILNKIVPTAQIPTPLPDSILFYEHQELYTESEAVLHIMSHLKFPFNLLSHFRIIPLSFRDFIYRFIARHRYRIIGRTESCVLPSIEQRARFIYS
jgi:predicted DCC family thiol-disulfide oxidoreductase YuxK